MDLWRHCRLAHSRQHSRAEFARSRKRAGAQRPALFTRRRDRSEASGTLSSSATAVTAARVSDCHHRRRCRRPRRPGDAGTRETSRPDIDVSVHVSGGARTHRRSRAGGVDARHTGSNGGLLLSWCAGPLPGPLLVSVVVCWNGT